MGALSSGRSGHSAVKLRCLLGQGMFKSLGMDIGLKATA
jgi:hypothetical protein